MTNMIFYVDQVRLAQLLKAEELMPTTNDPEHFSFWVCLCARAHKTHSNKEL